MLPGPRRSVGYFPISIEVHLPCQMTSILLFICVNGTFWLFLQHISFVRFVLPIDQCFDSMQVVVNAMRFYTTFFLISSWILSNTSIYGPRAHVISKNYEMQITSPFYLNRYCLVKFDFSHRNSHNPSLFSASVVVHQTHPAAKVAQKFPIKHLMKVFLRG